MRKVAIQRGHYGLTTGETGAAGEIELNSKIALKVKKILEQSSIAVTLLDALTTPPKTHLDAFIAVHADAASNTKAHGFSIGFPAGDSGELARHLRDTYKKKTGLVFRGFNLTTAMRRYYMFKKVNASGSAIIECGFLSHTTEQSWLLQHTALIAAAIAEGILKFFDAKALAAINLEKLDAGSTEAGETPV